MQGPQRPTVMQLLPVARQHAAHHMKCASSCSASSCCILVFTMQPQDAPPAPLTTPLQHRCFPLRSPSPRSLRICPVLPFPTAAPLQERRPLWRPLCPHLKTPRSFRLGPSVSPPRTQHGMHRQILNVLCSGGAQHHCCHRHKPVPPEGAVCTGPAGSRPAS